MRWGSCKRAYSRISSYICGRCNQGLRPELYPYTKTWIVLGATGILLHPNITHHFRWDFGPILILLRRWFEKTTISESYQYAPSWKVGYLQTGVESRVTRVGEVGRPKRICLLSTLDQFNLYAWNPHYPAKPNNPINTEQVWTFTGIGDCYAERY